MNNLTQPLWSLDSFLNHAFEHFDYTGEYFVLGVDLDRYDAYNPGKYLRGLLKDDLDGKTVRAFENYVGVVSSPPGPDFDNLTQMVNDYMERPPFNFPNPLNFFGGVKRVRHQSLSLSFFCVTLELSHQSVYATTHRPHHYYPLLLSLLIFFLTSVLSFFSRF